LAEHEATQVEEGEEEKDLCLMEGVEEVIKAVDEGDLLVLRRTSSGLRGSQDEQRENIFHSRCTIKGKVCSTIIDSGSCTNVASSNIVEKLQLNAIAHPHSYIIQWLNQGEGLQVNSRYLTSLSIGKNYHDEL